MGVWIETKVLLVPRSLLAVTPFVGVWIETAYGNLYSLTPAGHTLRGCVD